MPPTDWKLSALVLLILAILWCVPQILYYVATGDTLGA